MYTLWLLVKLHDSPETGVRYSRYLHICQATFGKDLSHLLPHSILSYPGIGHKHVKKKEKIEILTKYLQIFYVHSQISRWVI